ncbi:MAG: protein translocase subunit SecF [Nitrospirota bacterium]
MMLEVLGKTNIDFIEKRHIAFVFSGLLILLGFFAFIQIYMGKANLGIDFAGGAAIQLKSDRPVRIDEARSLLEKNGFGDVEFQEFPGANRLLIRIKKQEAIQGRTAEKILELFSDQYRENKFQIESSSEIGPTIGKKLQKDAIVAVTLSMIGIILYIAFRFEFKFGIAAAIATFHDILAVLGVIYILDKEITLLIITALLTLAGYSLSDTVVVFDRIRENLKKRNKETFGQVINSSINQVLGRTFMTGLTSILAVIALYIFGGDVIHDFALTLLIGIIVGTYSSWFIASPILFVWGSSRREGLLKKAYR